jgi:hypothetical protein
MAPFVEMAQTLKPVRTNMVNARKYNPIDCNTPALPTMKPIRINTATLHMDNATGQNTPGMVRSERFTKLTFF